MNLPIVTYKGEDTGRKAKLSKEIFESEPNDHAIYLDVKQYMANQRQGTHKTKERAEITGSTRKIKKQKGTGTARAGSIKSPIFKGGGRVFGPQPRSYSMKLNKKTKVVARKSALTYKAKDKELSIMEDFTFEAPKTKDFTEMLKALKLENKKVLVVMPESNKNVILSARNIPGAKVTLAEQLNTYEVLNADRVIISEASIEKLNNILN